MNNNKQIPRPGDVIKFIDRDKTKESVVTEGRYTNGEPRFATSDIAWIPLSKCEFVRMASDAEFIKALKDSGQ